MDARETLLKFLDERVFLPAAHADPHRYDAQDRGVLKRVRHSVIRTQIRYHEEYTSAEQVKENFRRDLASSFGQSLAADLLLLKLPRFEDVKDEFFGLCQSHEI
jgi:hypothetical protein